MTAPATTTATACNLPEASLRLGVSLDRLRWLLRTDRELASRIPRLAGRWLIGPEQLELLRSAVGGTR